MFVHTLDVVPREWYAQLELRRETVTWETMTSNFVHMFDVWEGEMMVDNVLQLTRGKIFEGISEAEGSLPD